MTTYEEQTLLDLHRIKSYYAYDARRRINAKRGQVVHHIDGNALNNELSNLAVVGRSGNR